LTGKNRKITVHFFGDYTTYISSKYIDFSVIDEKYQTDNILTIFRDPVSRAVSKFYVEKISKNLHDFVENPELMMKYRNIWQDGQASVSWLTGTNIDIGSDTLKISKENSETKDGVPKLFSCIKTDQIERNYNQNLFFQFILLFPSDLGTTLADYQFREKNKVW